MSQRSESFLRIATVSGDPIPALFLELSQKSDDEQLSVPASDFFVIALAKLLAEANPAVAQALGEVMDAYQTMASNPDPASAVEEFNATIGVQVYSVQSIQENAS